MQQNYESRISKKNVRRMKKRAVRFQRTQQDSPESSCECFIRYSRILYVAAGRGLAYVNHEREAVGCWFTPDCVVMGNGKCDDHESL